MDEIQKQIDQLKQEIDNLKRSSTFPYEVQKAIEELRVTPDFVIADGRSFSHETLKYRNIIDGDARSFTIGAASIIAKVTRDRLMLQYHERFPAYGFDQHKGYGTRQHLAAIRQYGLCEIHRKSFRRQMELFEGI